MAFSGTEIHNCLPCSLASSLAASASSPNAFCLLVLNLFTLCLRFQRLFSKSHHCTTKTSLNSLLQPELRLSAWKHC